MTRAALVVVIASTLAAIAVSPARADPLLPPPVLCGLNAIIDQLLGCPPPPPPPPPPSPPPPAPPPSSPSSSSSSSSNNSQPAPTLQSAQPVPRSAPRAQYVPDTFLVRFRSKAAEKRATALLHRLGVQSEGKIAALHVLVVHVAAQRRTDVFAALRHAGLVATIGRDEILHTFGVMTDDTFFDQQWGLQVADFTTAWQRTRGSPIVVAVVDTGVDASQPDLAGAVLPEVDLVNGASNAGDDNGHGTAVAGVIAAHANNGIGGAGVCWTCHILPIKAMDAHGSGDLATVATGIVRAADLGARIINLSLGGPQGIDVLQQAVTYANSKGAVVVAAAGNSGLSTPFYPANYPGVISVAGTDPNNKLYPWSDFGTWVQVAAPGCNVAPILAGGYGEFCGTSSATPLVAGLAALAISTNPSATPAQITNAIEQSAQRIAATIADGRIDASTAITAVAGAPITPIPVTTKFAGTLTRTVRGRAYTKPVAGGSIVATLRFDRGAQLTLTITDSNGKSISRSSRGAIVVKRSVATGALRIRVSARSAGRRPTHFRLTLTA